MKLALLSLFALAGVALGTETIQLATQGRLWLKVPAEQSPLQDVEVSLGSANPASWEKDPAVSSRHLDVIFPVRWWEWQELTISFTPVEDGTVDLVLSGPWAEEKPGALFRQEVLWDEIDAQGTSIRNGCFEGEETAIREAWPVLFGAPLDFSTWPMQQATPLAGKGLIASWQNRPVYQSLPVKAGKKVTLKLHAKAAIPPNFKKPTPLGKNTPAHLAARKLKRGVNLGNCWESVPPASWGIRYTEKDIHQIAKEGFDHIRIPVAWTNFLKKDGEKITLDTPALEELEKIMREALDMKLSVLLDWHHYDELTSRPDQHQEDFIKGWEAISRHFKNWPAGLMLELLNEPKDALTTERINPLHEKAISAIRNIDPDRIIFISPGKWGDARELDKLLLPAKDDRLIVTIHCYEPFFFTHQGASWVNLSELKGIVYPGPPATPLSVASPLGEQDGIRTFVNGYNTLPPSKNPSSPAAARELMDLAVRWSEHFGRPIHLGEFGSHRVADADSRSRYVRDMRTLAEERNIPWTLWDWKAGFAYWDSEKDQPILREAIFGAER